jgi:hypothetical protein
VILASSLQRLILYESAYGFSELRTYTHIFIYWLAGLILVAIVLDLLRQRGRFALALLICVIGFGATLALLNVDGFIVEQNVKRAVAGEELDFYYLNQLSTDAVPAMVEQFQRPDLSKTVKEVLGSALACRAATMEDPGAKPWQGFNLSSTTAFKALQENAALWSSYKVVQDKDLGATIKVGGEVIQCFGNSGMD